MDNYVGFNRNIYLSWLDATAALCTEFDDPAAIRERLDGIVGQDITSPHNRRRAIDILINIWIKSGEVNSRLRNEAVATFHSTAAPVDRLWLHYGLTLLYYPFFRETTATIGQLLRLSDSVTLAAVKQRQIAERGQLGSLEKAIERIIFSLRNWGLLLPGSHRTSYRPPATRLSAGDQALEAWLLECVLQAHPAQMMIFADLIRLPELFPFQLTVSVDTLRRSPHFEVERQGAGWDMVRQCLSCTVG